MRQGHAIFEPIDHLLCSYSFFKAQLFSKGKTNLMARIRRIEREFTPNLRTLTSCREERKRKTIDLLTTPTLEPFLFDKLLSQKTIRFQVISEKEEEKSKLGCRDEIRITTIWRPFARSIGRPTHTPPISARERHSC